MVIDEPGDVVSTEEETLRERQQQQQQEADMNAAANEFLSIVKDYCTIIHAHFFFILVA